MLLWGVLKCWVMGIKYHFDQVAVKPRFCISLWTVTFCWKIEYFGLFNINLRSLHSLSEILNQSNLSVVLKSWEKSSKHNEPDLNKKACVAIKIQNLAALIPFKLEIRKWPHLCQLVENQRKETICFLIH